MNVSHSTFISEARPQQKWKKRGDVGEAVPDPTAGDKDDFNDIAPGKGEQVQYILKTI
jgi:hypothetical protein